MSNVSTPFTSRLARSPPKRTPEYAETLASQLSRAAQDQRTRSRESWRLVGLDSMLFVSGQVKRADLKGWDFAASTRAAGSRYLSLVRPITKYAITVTEPMEIRAHSRQPSGWPDPGRPGPVWIDIPLDVQAARIDPECLVGAEDTWRTLEPAYANALGAEALALAASDVARVMRAAERPVLLAGNGIRIAGAAERFQVFVERTGVPVLTTRLGVDLLPASDPLCFGVPGTLASRAANFTLQNSDFLLTIGARLDFEPASP